MIPASDNGKCLGYWWRGDLLATKSVDEKLGVPFFTMAALASSRAISVHFHQVRVGVLCDVHTAVWGRELDNICSKS